MQQQQPEGVGPYHTTNMGTVVQAVGVTCRVDGETFGEHDDGPPCQHLDDLWVHENWPDHADWWMREYAVRVGRRMAEGMSFTEADEATAPELDEDTCPKCVEAEPARSAAWQAQAAERQRQRDAGEWIEFGFGAAVDRHTSHVVRHERRNAETGEREVRGACGDVFVPTRDDEPIVMCATCMSQP